MDIKFERIHDYALLPEHSYGGQHENVGMDFFAAEKADWSLITDGIYSCVVSTGLKMQLPPEHHLRFASRSGLGFKKNIIAFPGTVDHAYRGELKIKLFAFSDGPPEPIKVSEKVAQGIVFRSLNYTIVEDFVDVNTVRSERGFGSSDNA